MTLTVKFCFLSTSFLMAASFIMAKIAMLMEWRWNNPKLLLLTSSLASFIFSNFWRTVLRVPSAVHLGSDLGSIIDLVFIDIFLMYFGAYSLTQARNSQAVRNFLQKRAALALLAKQHQHCTPSAKMCTKEVEEAKSSRSKKSSSRKAKESEDASSCVAEIANEEDNKLSSS